jgi:hypothetical protein
MPKMQPAFMPNDIIENLMLQQLGEITGCWRRPGEINRGTAFFVVALS